jgi:hypothetical protein
MSDYGPDSAPPPAHRGKAVRRIILRAFNGAMLGLPVGGLLGAGLGGVFAQLVFWDSITSPFIMGAMFGVFPGLFAGAVIGTTMVVRDRGRGLKAGIAVGFWVGFLYSMPFWNVGARVAVPVIASGVIGGLVLSLLLRWIRDRWSWWTRWENGNP